MAFIMIDVPDSKRNYYKQILSEFREITVLNEEVDIDSVFTPQFIEKLNKRKDEKTYTLEELRQRIRTKYQEYEL